MGVGPIEDGVAGANLVCADLSRLQVLQSGTELPDAQSHRVEPAPGGEVAACLALLVEGLGDLEYDIATQADETRLGPVHGPVALVYDLTAEVIDQVARGGLPVRGHHREVGALDPHGMLVAREVRRPGRVVDPRVTHALAGLEKLEDERGLTRLSPDLVAGVTKLGPVVAREAEAFRAEALYEIIRVGDVQGQRVQSGPVPVQKAPGRTRRPDWRRHRHERDVSDEQQSKGHSPNLAPLPHLTGEHVLVPPDCGVEVVDDMADVEHLPDVEHATIMVGPDGGRHPGPLQQPGFRRPPIATSPSVPSGPTLAGYIDPVTLIQPRNFHRLALAVDDVPVAAAWLQRFLGAVPIAGGRGSGRGEGGPGQHLGGLPDTDTLLLWVGGYPFILLSGGAVARFLERHGPGVQSFAWEVDDNWEVEHIVRDRGIDVISVNMAGRFFFMHPRHTHGLLMEWCDGRMPRDSLPPTAGGGVVDISGLAWASGVVADADATADWMAGLMETKVVEDNPAGPAELERTVDLLVGDITIRLITPISPDSRYAAALQSGPGVCSFALRVADLDAALSALDREGVKTAYRTEGLAATDPATTLGLRLEWSQ